MRVSPRILLASLLSLAAAAGLHAHAVAGERQPHMENALTQLRAARVELDAARADKGGYRVRAIADTDAAIADVEEGIKYARSH